MPTLAAHRPGNSFPLGATLVPGGANFSVFSKDSTGAQLLLSTTWMPQSRLE